MKRARRTSLPSRSEVPPRSPNRGRSRSGTTRFPDLGWELIRSGSFLGAFYVFLWQVVELPLLHHGGGQLRLFPTFFWGADFLEECLRSPGGLSEWLAALLSQTFSRSWAGALVVTGVAAALTGCLNRLLLVRGGRQWMVVRYVVPLLILALYARYLHVLGLGLSLLLTLAAVCLYDWGTRSAGRLAGSLWLTGLSAAVYGLADGGLAVFLWWAVLVGRGATGRRGVLWLAGLLAVVWPYVIGGWVFDLLPAPAYRGWLPLSEEYDSLSPTARVMSYSLWLLPPLLATAGAVREAVRGDRAREATVRSSQGWVGETALLAVATGLVMGLGWHREMKRVLAVDYYASQRQWSQVLRVVQAQPLHPETATSVNRALYHTGRLGDHLPLDQTPEALFSLTKDRRVYWRQIDLCLELGVVNIALHYATEAANFYGDRPFLLERLATANAALGNTDTAQVYENALRRVPFRPRIPGMEVERLREFGCQTNRLLQVPVENLLQDLLAANPNNRMAFEYLMAYYLLSKDLRGFAAHLPGLRAFPGETLPRRYAEAALMAAEIADLELNLPGRRIPPGIAQRYEEFKRADRLHGSNRRRAARELHQEYGDTFFYHHRFP